MFEQKMVLTNIRNKSAFIRKMCIDGHVFNLDLSALNEVQRLLGITANNVNQISRRVNSGGAAYRNDIAEVNEQLTEIRTYVREAAGAVVRNRQRETRQAVYRAAHDSGFAGV